MYKLVVIGGTLRGQEFPLEKGTFVIGRDPSCDIQMPIEGISKQHASITVSDDSCYIKDLDSASGIFINGEFVRNKTLQDKDRIALPDVIIQVVYVKEKKKIIKRKIEVDDDEEKFYKGGEPPQHLPGKILHFFKYKAMSFFYGMNFEWESRILFAILLTIFSVISITLIIYPLLESSNKLLLIETAKRGANYANEISRLNAGALSAKMFSALDTNFLEIEREVKSYELFDFQGRILRPLKKINEYIQDPFSNEAKVWAERTIDNSEKTIYKKLLREGRIGIAHKILAFDPLVQKTVPVGIIAIIFEPETLKTQAIENSKAYLESLVTVALIGIFFYGIVYFLSLRPVDEMQFQIEEALRGKRKNLESDYLMSEIAPLRSSVNNLIQRVRELSSDVVDEEELEEDTSYVNSLKEFMLGSGVPTMILDSEKNIQAINTEAEDITGIRESSSEGMNLLDVSREKGFSATVLELCENSASNAGSHQQSDYELSGINFSINISSLMGKDSFAKAFYITFLRES